MGQPCPQQGYSTGDSKPLMILKSVRITGLMLALIVTVITGCGLPDDYYLPQVDGGSNIIVSMNNRVEIIRLPSKPPEFYYLTSFVLYYRIYISDYSTEARIDETNMSSINSVLYTHVSQLNRFADTTTTTINISSIGNEFRNRGYYELELEGINISTVLTPSGSFSINFPLNVDAIPYMQIGGTPRNLYRSDEFIPVGDPQTFPRYFRNTVDLNTSANATATQNMDVTDKANAPPYPNRYTYVSLYIVTSGYHPENFNTIYSRPTFIGVFKLPEVS
jgi:hypothetical protein